MLITLELKWKEMNVYYSYVLLQKKKSNNKAQKDKNQKILNDLTMKGKFLRLLRDTNCLLPQTESSSYNRK